MIRKRATEKGHHACRFDDRTEDETAQGGVCQIVVSDDRERDTWDVDRSRAGRGLPWRADDGESMGGEGYCAEQVHTLSPLRFFRHVPHRLQ